MVSLLVRIYLRTRNGCKQTSEKGKQCFSWHSLQFRMILMDSGCVIGQLVVQIHEGYH